MDTQQNLKRKELPLLKDFTYFASIDLFIIQNITTIVWIYVLFRPHWNEWILVFFVDFVAFLLMTKFTDINLFNKIYPDTKIYFPKIDFEQISKLNPHEKYNLLNSIAEFPAARSHYIFWTNFFKIIPGFIVLVFFCHTHGEAYTSRLLKGILAEIICIYYMYSYTFACVSDNVSDLISKLHQKFDFKEAFLLYPLKTPSNYFMAVENIALFTISILYIWLVFTMLLTNGVYDKKTVFNLLAIIFVAILNLGSIYYHNRKFLLKGLNQIFNNIKQLDHKNYKILPLHSSQPLMTFDQTFNSLVQKIETRDRALEKWLALELHTQKYKNLGEIAGLVVHDLNAPLQAIDYAVDVLYEDHGLNQNKYILNIKNNADRAIQLVRSITARLKNEKGNEDHCSINEAYTYTIQILKSQFSEQNIEQVLFYFDHRLNNAKINISRVDLIHIFYNLFKNSLENFLENPEIKKPFIATYGHYDSINYEKNLLLFDNGSGLTLSEFDQMTDNESMLKISGHKGLGLKLTRRLIERNSGKITIVNLSEISDFVFPPELLPHLLIENAPGQGTTYRLTLK
ncbi:MAG: HAMP domain-containing histidine kinase [Oligoflexia bacterium]|nr:HAMP domain-containing histidine kinase [Oligoflexia bacterium]MBF0365874.1 HAMP domain-containing histidine kinase [Oligoflexia bacterium]